VPDAQGNFVWLAAASALEVAAAFEAAGLIVRPFAGDGVRISIGEHESIDRVVEVASAVALAEAFRHPLSIPCRPAYGGASVGT
jgi:histidinol-phosphate aminotransferase